MIERNIRIEFGPWLKQRRLEKGYSLREAAAGIGISYGHLGLIEKGQRGVPSLRTLDNMAKYYGVNYQTMLRVARVNGASEIPEAPTQSVSRGASEILTSERLEWAYKALCCDPEFGMGYTMERSDLADAVKFAFVEIYIRRSQRGVLTAEELSAGIELYAIKEKGRRSHRHLTRHESEDAVVPTTETTTPARRIRMNAIAGNEHNAGITSTNSPEEFNEENQSH